MEEYAYLIYGVTLMIVSAIMSVQLWSGRWLFLLAKPEKTKKGLVYLQSEYEMSKRVSWLMVAFFACVVTLLAFEMAQIAQSTLYIQITIILNCIGMGIFSAGVVFIVFNLRKDASFWASFKTSGYRLALFLAISCAMLTSASLLYS